MAKVDVLIPTWNRGGMLKDAIQSILKQTEQDFRILIWDDGSTDGSTDPEVLPVDPRIVVLNRGGENQGIPYARNQLLKHIESPYACWQDSDDIAHPERLTKMLEYMDETGIDAGMSYLFFFNGNLTKKHWYLYKVDTTKYAVPDINGNPHNYGLDNNMTFATMFFKNPLKDTRFDETKRVSEDCSWIQALLRQGSQFGTLSEPLYFARRHPNRTTTLVRKARQEKHK